MDHDNQPYFDYRKLGKDPAGAASFTAGLAASSPGFSRGPVVSFLTAPPAPASAQHSSVPVPSPYSPSLQAITRDSLGPATSYPASSLGFSRGPVVGFPTSATGSLPALAASSLGFSRGPVAVFPTSATESLPVPVASSQVDDKTPSWVNAPPPPAVTNAYRNQPVYPVPSKGGGAVGVVRVPPPPNPVLTDAPRLAVVPGGVTASSTLDNRVLTTMIVKLMTDNQCLSGKVLVLEGKLEECMVRMEKVEHTILKTEEKGEKLVEIVQVHDEVVASLHRAYCQRVQLVEDGFTALSKGIDVRDERNRGRVGLINDKLVHLCKLMRKLNPSFSGYVDCGSGSLLENGHAYLEAEVEAGDVDPAPAPAPVVAVTVVTAPDPIALASAPDPVVAVPVVIAPAPAPAPVVAVTVVTAPAPAPAPAPVVAVTVVTAPDPAPAPVVAVTVVTAPDPIVLMAAAASIAPAVAAASFALASAPDPAAAAAVTIDKIKIFAGEYLVVWLKKCVLDCARIMSDLEAALSDAHVIIFGQPISEEYLREGMSFLAFPQYSFNLEVRGLCMQGNAPWDESCFEMGTSVRDYKRDRDDSIPYDAENLDNPDDIWNLLLQVFLLSDYAVCKEILALVEIK